MHIQQFRRVFDKFLPNALKYVDPRAAHQLLTLCWSLMHPAYYPDKPGVRKTAAVRAWGQGLKPVRKLRSAVSSLKLD